MGIRGRNSPVLSWQVKPVWNPKICKKSEVEVEYQREEKKRDMKILQCNNHKIYWMYRKNLNSH